jgi:hypothetical protein
METVDQSSAVLMRGFEVATDAGGRFAFTHMPARTELRIFTPAKELEAINAGLVAQIVSTGTNGSTLRMAAP